ncbi:MAG: hypothetical protein ACI3T9_00990 [Romboutsia timonensis]
MKKKEIYALLAQKDKEIERLLSIIEKCIPPKEIKLNNKKDEDFKQKQAEGIKKAKKAGVKFGRPKIKIPDKFNYYMIMQCRQQFDNEKFKINYTDKYIMNKLELKPNTYYTFRREWREKNGYPISKQV